MTSLPDLILPKREFFGLSIDKTSLRGVQLDRKGKVTKYAEVQLPQDFFSQSTLINGEAFREAIQELRQKGKFTTSYVVVCFPEAFAYTRELILPKVSIDEIGEGVKWHVKELFPFPEDDIYFDWKIVREEKSELILAVVAVPKRTIDPITNSLVSIGLKPLRLKPDASAIATLLSLANNAHAIVTEVNKTGAYVTLVEGEKAVFTTVISYTKDDTPVTYLTNVKQTIQEITTYYRQRNIIKEETVQIILTGEIASEQWVQQLPQPTKILNTPLNSPAFNKAYASALSQVSPTSDHETINLLPPHLQQVYDNERTQQFYTTVLYRTIAFVGAYTLVMVLVFGLLLVEQQQIDTNVKRLNTIVQSQGANSQALLSVNGIAKQIVALAPLRKTPKDSLEAFILLIPEGVTISQWEFDDGKQEFTVTGVGKTRDTLLDLKAKLEESNMFARVNLPLSYLESPSDIPFVIKFVPK